MPKAKKDDEIALHRAQIAALHAELKDLRNVVLAIVDGRPSHEPPKPIVKGGWVNVYKLTSEGLPDLNGHPTNGPFETRGEADDFHKYNYLGKSDRIVCLYLQGTEEEGR